MTGNEGITSSAVRRVLLFSVLLVAAALLLVRSAEPAAAQDGQQWNNDYCLGCHDTDSLPVTLASGEILDVAVHGASYEASVHGQREVPCILCHTNIEGFPHPELTAETRRQYSLELYTSCFTCHQSEFTETRDNDHARALHEGIEDAAVCTDCHGSHEVQWTGQSSTAIPATCQQCHSEIYDLYADSVHGAALFEEGNADVPTCTDCHGTHNVAGPQDDTPFRLFSPQLCAECHADQELMDQYDISTNVFDSYLADFHGTTVVLYEDIAPDQQTNKPVCIDCHGVHHILPPDETDSTVFAENLLVTCQRCHPDATANFPESWLSHYDPTVGRAPLVFLVNLFYQLVIPGVIGGMLIYVLLDIFRRSRKRRSQRTYA
jgi:hypothetical protein